MARMDAQGTSDPTALLRMEPGRPRGVRQADSPIHDELHRIARRPMRLERPGHTLQATALVNEAYLRLIDVKQKQWQNRAHFLALAARVMRRILVDSARARRFQKRGAVRSARAAATHPADQRARRHRPRAQDL
jgi:RNA polymerase sigma factor (TIGR02999 family)